MNGQMSVSKDTDKAEGRRVWYRDVEVPDWVEADEFRRVVITATGKVLNGDVRVERMECDKPPAPEQISEPEIPADSFEVNPATGSVNGQLQDYTKIVPDWQSPPPPQPVDRDILADGIDKPSTNDASFNPQGL